MSDQTPPPGDPTPPPPPPPPASPAPGAEAPLSPSDEKTYAMLAQFGGIIIGFLAGLIVMLVWGKRSAFVDAHAKEALNFQITVLIGYIAATVLTFVVPFLFFLTWAIWIASLVLSIMAGMAASRNEPYRYPFALRLVS